MRNYQQRITSLADQVGAIVVHGARYSSSHSTKPRIMESGLQSLLWGRQGSEINDAGFLIELIENVIMQNPVDENRVYFTGWSNGCGMSQRMALAVQPSDKLVGSLYIWVSRIHRQL